MIDSGETAQDAAPKGKRKTLRQKDRILDDTLESNDAPTKPNLSGQKDRAHGHVYLFMHFFCKK